MDNEKKIIDEKKEQIPVSNDTKVISNNIDSSNKNEEVKKEVAEVVKEEPKKEEVSSSEVTTPKETSETKESVSPVVKEEPKESIPSPEVKEEKTPIVPSTPVKENTPVVPEVPTKEETPETKTNEVDSESPKIEPPAFEIPEEKKDEKIQGQTSDMNANFSSIFNTESEEQPTPQNAPATGAPKVSTENTVSNTESTPQATSTPVNEQAPQTIEADHSSKKNLTDEFNADEKVLYTIPEETESNPIGVFIFFTIIIAFIFLLPAISSGTKQYLNSFSDSNTTTETEETEQDDEYYYFKTSLKATIADLEFTNFVTSKDTKIEEYRISFTINNIGSSVYQFDKKYYVVLYDEDQIVDYTLIHSYEPLAPNAARELTLVISQKGFENADRLKIEEIPTSKYPDVEMNLTDGDYKILTCSYLHDEMEYYFLEGKLSKIKETYSTTTDDVNYESDKETYQELFTKLNSISGINSVFVENQGNAGFKMVNSFELKNVQDTSLANLEIYRFFKYNEDVNTVSFEMEAQGYTCN